MTHASTRGLLTGTACFALAIGISATPTSAAITMVAAWDLNEGTGTTTTQYQRGSLEWNQVTNPQENLAATASADFSTATGLTWGSASGAPGSTASLTFAGHTGTHVLNTNVSGTALGGTGAKTFVAWINPTAANGGILSYSPKAGTGNGQDLRLRLNADGELRAELNGGAVEHDGYSFLNQGWQMVAVVFESNRDNTKLYRGGSGFVTITTGGNNVALNTGTTTGTGGNLNFVIGGTHTSPAAGFTGGIDMVAVYNGAATLEELNAIYTQGIAIPEPATLAPLGLGGVALLRRRRAGERV